MSVPPSGDRVLPSFIDIFTQEFLSEAKDEDKKEAMASSSSSSSVLNLAGIGSLGKDRRQHNGNTRQRKSGLLFVDEHGGTVAGAWIAGDVSPVGTLTRGSGSDTQKNRSNLRSHSKLQSLFSLVKPQDKHEQLAELLAGYSSNGLPKMPDLLTLGRPHYDPSVFQLERHWIDIVANHAQLSKRQRDQQEAVWELLSTEVEYIRKLRAIIDVFMCCLLDLQNEQILNEIDSEKLFSNVCDVYYATCHFWANHMSQVLRLSRETRESLDPCLLKAGFLVFDKIFEPYTKYCLEQETCREYIKTNMRDNELFRTFIVWGEAHRQCSRLKLVDLIVKPWQHLTKYKLLLYAMRKPLDKMEPSSDANEQRNDITAMIQQVDEFIQHVNIAMRQRHECKQLSIIIDRIESYDAIDLPSDECLKLVTDYCRLDLTCPVPGCGQQEMRILLLEGNLKLKDAYSKMDVCCMLFTDMLLVTKPATKRGGGDKLKIAKPPMRLDKIVVHGLRDAASFMLLYLNEYQMAQAVYTFHGDSKLWLESITKAQSEYRDKRSQYAARNESLLLDLYDDVLDDDDSAMNRTQDTALLGRQDSDPVADTYLPNRSLSSSSSSPVHRSRSYTDNIASVSEATSTAAATTAGTAPGRSEVLSRPRSASALIRPRVPSAVEGQSPILEGSVNGRITRRLRSCEPSPSTSTVGKSVISTSQTDGDRTDVAPTNSTGEDSGSDDTGSADSGGAARSRLNQRRAVRAERRYHTADTIHDIDRRSEHDITIHKRLSLNYGGARTHLPAAEVSNGSLRLPECSSSALSCESLGSFPSSSGVSSTASLYRANDDVGDNASGNVDPTKLLSHDDGHRDPQDAETTDETADRRTPRDSAATTSEADPTAAQRLQFLVAERRRLNQELLFMNPALEASEV